MYFMRGTILLKSDLQSSILCVSSLGGQKLGKGWEVQRSFKRDDTSSLF